MKDFSKVKNKFSRLNNVKNDMLVIFFDDATETK